MSRMPQRRRKNRQPKLRVVRGVPAEQRPPQPVDLREVRQQLEAAGAPEELLAALDTTTDPAEFHDVLADAIASAPQELAEDLVDAFGGLLDPHTTPLDAELHAAEFLGMVGTTAPDPELIPEMLADLFATAESAAGPEAMAMLRSVAAVATPEVRSVAHAAAERLAAAGAADPPWAAGIGGVEFARAYGYRDDFGEQEGIAVVFRYGRKEHAVVVLIDHVLGGGVKDVFLTDKTRKIRSQLGQMTRMAGSDLVDYDAQRAHLILSTALDHEPCPQLPDQVEDVASFLGLLRSRTDRLAADAPADGERARANRSSTVHRIKITLRGTKPPVWRRLEVPSTITLDRLHEVIGAAFEWLGYHLWMFETPAGEFGQADPELGHRSAARTTLGAVAPRPKDKLSYLYDFGDDWRHIIEVEAVTPAQTGESYPRCLTGRRAGPPEDCGGVGGYAELCQVLADPQHPEHEDRLEWLGLASAEEFDPDAVDVDEVNEVLAEHARVLVRG